ncbi:unknown [Clostridium sp. CAG:273]|nr:unknown [Clostridium sp. CAG:273]
MEFNIVRKCIKKEYIFFYTEKSSDIKNIQNLSILK